MDPTLGKIAKKFLRLLAGRRVRWMRTEDAAPVIRRRERFDFDGGGFDQRDLATMTMTVVHAPKRSLD